jgi:hypothetical protein
MDILPLVIEGLEVTLIYSFIFIFMLIYAYLFLGYGHITLSN